MRRLARRAARRERMSLRGCGGGGGAAFGERAAIAAAARPDIVEVRHVGELRQVEPVALQPANVAPLACRRTLCVLEQSRELQPRRAERLVVARPVDHERAVGEDGNEQDGHQADQPVGVPALPDAAVEDREAHRRRVLAPRALLDKPRVQLRVRVLPLRAAHLVGTRLFGPNLGHRVRRQLRDEREVLRQRHGCIRRQAHGDQRLRLGARRELDPEQSGDQPSLGDDHRAKHAVHELHCVCPSARGPLTPSLCKSGYTKEA
eukprot:2127329-Prymnesium_polylepis.1